MCGRPAVPNIKAMPSEMASIGSETRRPGASTEAPNIEAASALANIRFNDRKYGEAAALYAKVTAAKGGDKNLWANYG